MSAASRHIKARHLYAVADERTQRRIDALLRNEAAERAKESAAWTLWQRAWCWRLLLVSAMLCAGSVACGSACSYDTRVLLVVAAFVSALVALMLV